MLPIPLGLTGPSATRKISTGSAIWEFPKIGDPTIVP